MVQLRAVWAAYHPIVWVMLVGTVFSRISLFMTMPFLAIYLSETSGLSPVLIGLTIGIGPLTSTLGSFIGGNLSDRYGRKVIMLSAIGVWMIVFVGFSLATSVWVFILLNAINGLCRSFFEPASQALLADLTPKAERGKVFGLRYLAINIGAVFGPLLGAYIGLTSGLFAFWITAGIYGLYGAAIWWMMNRMSLPSEEATEIGAKKGTTLREAWAVIRGDVALRYFVIAGVLSNIGYAQIESNLPQYLKDHFTEGVVLYSILLTVNALTVVVLQIPINAYATQRSPLRMMMLGSVLFSVGYIGFAIFGTWAGMIVSMIILTLGEMLVFPMGSVLLDRLAPEGMRGTYFGASGFRSLGHFIGPWFGGLLLAEWGGSVLFFIVAGIVMGSTWFYYKGAQVDGARIEPVKETVTVA